MDVERLPRADPHRVPDPREQLLTGHRSTRLLSEYGEQVELLRRELHLRAVDDDAMLGSVDCHPARGQRRVDSAASTDGSDAGSQLTNGVRLDHVVVSAEFQPDDPIGLIAPSCGDDDGHVGGTTNLAQDVDAVAIGKPEIEKDDIVKALKTISSHSLRVGLTHDLIALGADGVAITNAMRWTSPGTILRYGKKLRAKSSATARFLSSEPE